MNSLFSEQGLARLRQLIVPGALCAFDFDGTLSPLAGYDNARLPDTVCEKLRHLQALTPVAIVTGRTMPDIRARLTFKPDFLVASHGLEGVPGQEPLSEHYRNRVAQWAQKLEAALADTTRYDRGITLENKRYSLAIHYHRAADDATQEKLARLFAETIPDARVLPGKQIYHLLPPDAPNKGDALLALMAATGAKTALYAGDDQTDENVFALNRPDILTVRIGESRASRAEWYLDTQASVPPLLDLLIDTLSAARKTASPKGN